MGIINYILIKRSMVGRFFWSLEVRGNTESSRRLQSKQKKGGKTSLGGSRRKKRVKRRGGLVKSGLVVVDLGVGTGKNSNEGGDVGDEVVENGAERGADSVNGHRADNSHNLLDNKSNGVDNGVENHGGDNLASNSADDGQVGHVLGGLEDGGVELGDGVLQDLHLLGSGSLGLGDDGNGVGEHAGKDLNHVDEVTSRLQAGNVGQREGGGGSGLGSRLVLGHGGSHGQSSGGSEEKGSDVDHCGCGRV